MLLTPNATPGIRNEIVVSTSLRAGIALTTTQTTPAARNSQMISREVHAVEIARVAKIPHSNLSFPIVSLLSLNADRAIIPMTAAPIP